MTWLTHWLTIYWPLAIAATLFTIAVLILTHDRK